MFHVSVLLYNLSSIVEEAKDDRELLDNYRKYFRSLTGEQRAELFEKIITLPPELLLSLKLEYTPRVPKVYASLYTIPEDQSYRAFVLYKNDTDNPPTYQG